MTTVLGLDFETAQSDSEISTWNIHYQKPIEIGIYNLTNNTSFTSVIKADVYLSSWHKANIPTLIKEKISNGVDKCVVVDQISDFLKKNCKNGCKIATYGDSDYKVLAQMYVSCNKELNIDNHDLYRAKTNKLQIVNVNDLMNWKEPKFVKPTLVNLYKDTFDGRLLVKIIML